MAEWMWRRAFFWILLTTMTVVVLLVNNYPGALHYKVNYRVVLPASVPAVELDQLADHPAETVLMSKPVSLTEKFGSIFTGSVSKYPAHASRESAIYKPVPKLFGSSTQANFIVQENFTLPFPYATLPVDKLFQQQWMKDLMLILSDIPRHSATISVVCSDLTYKEMLLNWLIQAKIQAKPPLEYVIVLSLSKQLCELLLERSLQCVYISDEIFNDLKVRAHGAFAKLLVIRTTVIRLMNHWGYDVANYDSDAMVLKNPEQLFLQHKDSHIVASFGRIPSHYRDKWGATWCGGMFMMRSSQYTEMFWETLGGLKPRAPPYDDQHRLNSALDASNIKWDVASTNVNIPLEFDMTGVTKYGLQVTLLSGRYVCRRECVATRIEEYYVWHRRVGTSSDVGRRVSADRRLGFWHLANDWNKKVVADDVIGTEWLKSISGLSEPRKQ